MSIYLSASSISDFIKCPQKVFYRLGKSVKEVPSKEMIIGKIAHKAIEDGWEDRGKSYDIIHKMSGTEKLSKADITNLEFYMDMFFLNFKGLLSNKDLIEYNFKLPLHDDVFLVGKIDRISNKNLFDWKTGQKLPMNLGNDVQCIIYDYAYKQLFKEEPSSICLASLAKGELIPYRASEIHVNELFTNIIPRMIKVVRNSDYERLGIFNHSCFRCPYRFGCLGSSQGEEEYVVDNRISPE